MFFFSFFVCEWRENSTQWQCKINAECKVSFEFEFVEMEAMEGNNTSVLLDCCRNGISSSLYFFFSSSLKFLVRFGNKQGMLSPKVPTGTCMQKKTNKRQHNIFHSKVSHSPEEKIVMAANVGICIFCICIHLVFNVTARMYRNSNARRQLVVTFIFMHTYNKNVVCHQHSETPTHTAVHFSFNNNNNNNNHNPKFIYV